MKKYYIHEVKQKEKVFYALIADPRVIVRMMGDVKAGEEQESQRPWDEKRVKEISEYVAGKFKESDSKESIGLIPNAPILNIKNTISIQNDAAGTYIELPETDDEFAKYKDTIEAIDGQHRIRAFMKDYVDVSFSGNTAYNMIFTLFYQMSTREKKEIFMVTNEKQKQVPTNLLRVFKRQLDLLTDDAAIYDLVVLLNTEDFSPLKNRIMVGSKKIKNGYAENQLSKIIKNSNTFNVLQQRKLSQEKMLEVISNYLKAWEEVYGIKYSEPKGTATKICGLRYVFFLFETCLDILINRMIKAEKDEFKKLIEHIADAVKIADVFHDDSTSDSFRVESGTIKLAKDHATKLKNYVTDISQKNFTII